MSNAYKKYDDEFKKIIINQVESGKRYIDIAKRYNISPPNIRYWYKKYLEEKENKVNTKQ